MTWYGTPGRSPSRPTTRQIHAAIPTKLMPMSATPQALPGENGFSMVRVWKTATANGMPMSLCVSRHHRNGTHRTRLIAMRT